MSTLRNSHGWDGTMPPSFSFALINIARGVLRTSSSSNMPCPLPIPCDPGAAGMRPCFGRRILPNTFWTLSRRAIAHRRSRLVSWAVVLVSRWVPYEGCMRMPRLRRAYRGRCRAAGGYVGRAVCTAAMNGAAQS
jgi:hypothetical protein